MVSTLRTPPRFVPTLTAVVELTEPPVPPAETPEAVAETDAIVSQAAFHSPEEEQAAMAPGLALSDAEAFRFEEGLVHRVLQRVDLSLEAERIGIRQRQGARPGGLLFLGAVERRLRHDGGGFGLALGHLCLLYTSPSPRDS